MWLLIDNYDSFSHILWDYLKQVHHEVLLIHNDTHTLEGIIALAPDRIILSPGPKAPDQAGVTMAVIGHFFDKVPILGVCLGHQALAQYWGCEVAKAPAPMHGKTSLIYHKGESLFASLPNPLEVMRYHSLIIKGCTQQEQLEILAETEDGIVMAFRHRKYPLVGLQFHPESVLTQHGLDMLQHWANCYV